MQAFNHDALWSRLQAQLCKRSLALYLIGRAAHVKKGRKASTYRWAPDAFQNEACKVLGYGDSEAIAATIHAYELRGY